MSSCANQSAACPLITRTADEPQVLEANPNLQAPLRVAEENVAVWHHPQITVNFTPSRQKTATGVVSPACLAIGGKGL
jgi:hypothetical protein